MSNNKILYKSNIKKPGSIIYTELCGIVLNKNQVKLIKNKKFDISKYKILVKNKRIFICNNNSSSGNHNIFLLLIKKKQINYIINLLKQKNIIIMINLILEINSLIKVDIVAKKKLIKNKKNLKFIE